jgi:hypothetical protein
LPRGVVDASGSTPFQLEQQYADMTQSALAANSADQPPVATSLVMETRNASIFQVTTHRRNWHLKSK